MPAGTFVEFNIVGCAGGGEDFLQIRKAGADSIDGEDSVFRPGDNQHRLGREQPRQVGHLGHCLDARNEIARAVPHGHYAAGESGEVATRRRRRDTLIDGRREYRHCPAAAVSCHHDPPPVGILAGQGPVQQLHRIGDALSQQRSAQLHRPHRHLPAAAAFIANVLGQDQLAESPPVGHYRQVALADGLDAVVPLAFLDEFAGFFVGYDADGQRLAWSVAMGCDTDSHLAARLRVRLQHVERYGQFILGHHVPAATNVSVEPFFLDKPHRRDGPRLTGNHQQFQKPLVQTLLPDAEGFTLPQTKPVRLPGLSHHSVVQRVDRNAKTGFAHNFHLLATQIENLCHN